MNNLVKVKEKDVQVGQMYQLGDGSKCLIVAETHGENHIGDFHTSPTWVGWVYLDEEGRAHHFGYGFSEPESETPFYYI
jgi:uncharacterized protein involved in tellurium resistance